MWAAWGLKDFDRGEVLAELDFIVPFLEDDMQCKHPFLHNTTVPAAISLPIEVYMVFLWFVSGLCMKPAALHAIKWDT